MRPFLSRHSACPRCGTDRVKKLAGFDLVDRLSRHPLSLIQALFFAPLHHCPFCRLQFFDLRPLSKRVRARRAAAG